MGTDLKNLSPAVARVCLFLALSSSPTFAGPSVQDDLENTVSLDAPATRIISLAPHNTENLFSAGAGDQVVGVVEYSDYPSEALERPSVGSHVQFNLEAIIALEPDLVVAWRTGNNAEALKRIEGFGIPVYYSEPRSFEDVIGNVRDLGILSGTEAVAEAAVDGLLNDIDALRDRYQTRETVRVFYQIWSEPLMTLNGEHFVSRVLEVCGASNLFADLPIIAPKVSMEAVIEANPDLIMTGLVEGHEPDMSQWAPWQSVTAVARSLYVYVDSDVMHRHTLRMLRGIDIVCEDIDAARQQLMQ